MMQRHIVSDQYAHLTALARMELLISPDEQTQNGRFQSVVDFIVKPTRAQQRPTIVMLRSLYSRDVSFDTYLPNSVGPIKIIKVSRENNLVAFETAITDLESGRIKVLILVGDSYLYGGWHTNQDCDVCSPDLLLEAAMVQAVHRVRNNNSRGLFFVQPAVKAPPPRPPVEYLSPWAWFKYAGFRLLFGRDPD